MKFKAIAAVTFGAGTVLGLTEDQVRARSHLLAPVHKDKLAKGDKPAWYETKAATQFKCGEEFLYDGDLPKALAAVLELPNGESAATAAARRKAKPAAADVAEPAAAAAKA